MLRFLKNIMNTVLAMISLEHKLVFLAAEFLGPNNITLLSMVGLYIPQKVEG